MSTTTLTKPETPTTSPEARPARFRYKLVSAILGLASVGAVVLFTVGGGSTSPDPRPPNPAPAVYAPASEVFPGCINDLECNGAPSHLPPGYWNSPIGSSVD